MKMIFDYNALPIADNQVELTLLNAYNLDSDIYYSNSLVSLCARVLIAEGTFDYNKVEFFVGERSIGFCSKYGQTEEYPDEFCSFDVLLDRILEAQWSNKKNIKNEGGKKL